MTDRPLAPEWLDDGARAEWDRVVSGGLVTVTAGNRAIVEGYCVGYSAWRAAEEILRREGREVIVRDDKGIVKTMSVSPQMRIAKQYFEQARRCAGMLGLIVGGGVALPSGAAEAGNRKGPAKASSVFGRLPRVQ